MLGRLSRNSYVVIGRAGVDVFTDPGTRLEEAGRMSIDLGGSAANIAAGICKLGGRASLVTRVSADAVGSFARARLAH